MAVAVPPMPDASQIRKGILKAPRRTYRRSPSPRAPRLIRSRDAAATAAPSESHRSTTPHKPSRPKSSAPPPRISCSATPLHWLLSPPIQSPRTIPGGKLVTQQVIFDVTKPVSLIALRDITDRSVIRGQAVLDYLSRPVCSVNPLKEMTLRCVNLPDFDIQVKGKDGAALRCLDVFNAIYAAFDEITQPYHRERYVKAHNQQRCLDAFERRCRHSHRQVADAEKAFGMRFVDLLEGNSYFHGLTTPLQGSRLDRDGKVWYVTFGRHPPPDPIMNTSL
ncbi:hypothetical protein NUW54_g10780 [Trametes sanguinea]|uniref:Uncharacterized protein n=1 Tax=Trametes sanguinea TaxID=158606 RepID=A0ACC1NSW9_9APHY|nr:hypothetical protein NUW54_g10780 [Trametes sanguinea]